MVMAWAIVKAGMEDRKDETPALLQQARQRGQQRLDLGHVEQSHVAERGVKATFPKAEQGALVGGIQGVIFDALAGLGALAGEGDQLLRKVKGYHLRAQRRQAARGQPIPTGDIQDALAGLRLQQTLDRRPDQQIEKVVALAHALIPIGCIGIPGVAGLDVGVFPFLGHGFLRLACGL